MENLESVPEQHASTLSSGALSSRTGSETVPQSESIDEHLSEDSSFMPVTTTSENWHTDQITRRTSNSRRSQQHSHDDLSETDHSPSANGIPTSGSLSSGDLDPKNPNTADLDARHLYPTNYAEVAALQHALGPTLEDFRDQVDVEPLVDTSQSYMEQIISLQHQADAAWASMSDNGGFGDQPAVHAQMPRPLIHLTRWEGSIMDWRNAQFTDGLGLWDIPDSDEDGDGEGEGEADIEEVEETTPPESSAQSGCGFKVYEDFVIYEDPLPERIHGAQTGKEH
ncbi:MAG: hypothetical protein LQ342_000615 [Letrouitia transgressa]|nr:MAG: hypothetical protein LQ342_000615 [Letrouitia transgressa]